MLPRVVNFCYIHPVCRCHVQRQHHPLLPPSVATHCGNWPALRERDFLALKTFLILISVPFFLYPIFFLLYRFHSLLGNGNSNFCLTAFMQNKFELRQSVCACVCSSMSLTLCVCVRVVNFCRSVWPMWYAVVLGVVESRALASVLICSILQIQHTFFIAAVVIQ